ncbi:hypothetical protein ES703_62518 [subsurface metagenome]
MKKILVVAAVLLVCLFGFSGLGLAAEISTSGDLEFKLSGTSQEGAASGLFGAGDVLVNYGVTLTSGAFEANLTPKFNLADEALEVEDAYIKWAPDTLSVTMKPLGIDKELYDIEGDGGKPNIPSNPGLGIEIPVEDFTFDLVANNVAEGDTTKFGYALGAKYVIDLVTLEGLFGSSNVEDADWYGSYYGGKVAVDLAPLTLVGQYGTFSPEKANLEKGSGYFAEFAYALDEDLGTLSLQYIGIDENLNGAGMPTPEEYHKIYGEYSYPLTEAVSLTMDVANIEPGTGIDSYTEFGITVGVAL